MKKWIAAIILLPIFALAIGSATRTLEMDVITSLATNGDITVNPNGTGTLLLGSSVTLDTDATYDIGDTSEAVRRMYVYEARSKDDGNVSLNLNDRAAFGTGGGNQFNWDNAAYVYFTNDIRINGTTATTVPYLDANKQITSSAVTPTELGYLSGVTSNIQTQINALGGGVTLTEIDNTDSPYTLTTGTDILLVDSSSAAVTITLPAASGVSSGKSWVVKTTPTSIYTITINRAGSDTIDGETSQTLETPGMALSMFCDGTSAFYIY